MHSLDFIILTRVCGAENHVFVQGEGEPTIQELLDLKKLMTSSKDLRAPIQLESQLRANDSFDIEVTQSMMQMLEVPHCLLEK